MKLPTRSLKTKRYRRFSGGSLRALTARPSDDATAFTVSGRGGLHVDDGNLYRVGVGHHLPGSLIGEQSPQKSVV